MNVQIYKSVLEIIFISMVAVFFIAQYLKNNSIVDVFWGLGFVCIVLWFIFFQYASFTMLNVAVLLWGVRLSSYIFVRNFGKGEDWRYRNFRKAWGSHPLLGAFFQVFILQGLIMFFVALPVIHGNLLLVSLNALNYIGVLLWGIGFFYEAIADYQLYRFKKNSENKGKVMRYGLWKLSRHPNYFGELLVWWGIWLMSVNLQEHLSSLISLISPLLMTGLLTKVSGVPLLEKKYERHPEYEAYVKTTPAIFPFFGDN